ncbi:hypothetical protein ACWCP6_25435 [Streptomyces sp. NPDC002004]
MSIAELVAGLRDSGVKPRPDEGRFGYREPLGPVSPGSPGRLRACIAGVAESTPWTSRAEAGPWTATEERPVIPIRVDPHLEQVGGAENGARHER